MQITVALYKDHSGGNVESFGAIVAYSVRYRPQGMGMVQLQRQIQEAPTIGTLKTADPASFAGIPSDFDWYKVFRRLHFLHGDARRSERGFHFANLQTRIKVRL